ncbi:hypothetical protein Bca101_019019 [Brassica carinata]
MEENLLDICGFDSSKKYRLEELIKYQSVSESKVRELEEEVKQTFLVIKKEKSLVDSVQVSLDQTSLGVFSWIQNIQDQPCEAVLSRFDQFKSSCERLSQVSVVMKIEEEKDCLVLNLARVEHEVELVWEHNRETKKENCKVLKQGSSHLCFAERSKSKKRKEKKAISSYFEKITPKNTLSEDSRL